MWTATSFKLLKIIKTFETLMSFNQACPCSYWGSHASWGTSLSVTPLKTVRLGKKKVWHHHCCPHTFLLLIFIIISWTHSFGAWNFCGWSHCITMSQSLKQSESPSSHPVLENNSGSHGLALASVPPLNLTLKYIPFCKVLKRWPLNQAILFEAAPFGI